MGGRGEAKKLKTEDEAGIKGRSKSKSRSMGEAGWVRIE
jgi:hypothetical protein